MSALAPRLEAFFTERLIRQRRASPHTISAYRDTFRMLVLFAAQRCGKVPSTLEFDDLDAVVVGDFLDHLETERCNSARTRNARLAAIHSFFNFAGPYHPEHAALIARVLAIQGKRRDRALVTYLDDNEMDALLGAPDLDTWLGRRDRAQLLLMLRTGLRVSELVGLRCTDLVLEAGAHVHCVGKGRKERITPISAQTVAVMKTWCAERAGGPDDPLFPTRRGDVLSRDAVAKLLDRHLRRARATCPSVGSKNVTPHTLRHSCAMWLLRGGVDVTVIALWLGHESVASTNIYLHAEMSIKERALERTRPSEVEPGRYVPSADILAFLDRL